MRRLLFLCCFAAVHGYGQELYVFSEPASNMPARSLSIRQTEKLQPRQAGGSTQLRNTTELMLGLNRNLMVHAATSFSNMYSPGQQWESVRVYAKYRFLSNDELYRHFRMSAFAEAGYSRNKPFVDELGIDGDQSGVQAGVIATQLLHKLALSTTVGFAKASGVDPMLPGPSSHQALNYSLSAGYLLLPKDYTSYGQTNINLYLELLGQQATNIRKYYLDLAPAVQLIFNSEAKLNIGYRFQLGSDMRRFSPSSWLIGFEWVFLNVLK